MVMEDREEQELMFQIEAEETAAIRVTTSNRSRSQSFGVLV